MRLIHRATKLRFVEKPPRKEGWRDLHRAAERRVPDAEKAVLAAFRELRRAAPLDQIRATVERGVPELVTDVIPWAILERSLEARLLPILTDVAGNGGEIAVRGLERHFRRTFEVRKADVSTGFDLTNPETIIELASHGARLVTLVTNETREAIRQVTLAAQQEGLDVREQGARIAAILRRGIGLNAQQARALANYDRTLREAGTPPSEIRRLLGLRREKMIQQRARVIARTETLNASRVGQDAIWRQARTQGLLPPDQKRKWLTQGNLNPNNPCPICSPMNGQIRGMDEAFVSPYNGATSMHGGIHVGCECVVVLSFD